MDDRAPAKPGDLFDQIGRVRVYLAAVDDDVIAGLRRLQREGAADAPGRARDQGAAA